MLPIFLCFVACRGVIAGAANPIPDLNNTSAINPKTKYEYTLCRFIGDTSLLTALPIHNYDIFPDAWQLFFALFSEQKGV